MMSLGIVVVVLADRGWVAGSNIKKFVPAWKLGGLECMRWRGRKSLALFLSRRVSRASMNSPTVVVSQRWV